MFEFRKEMECTPSQERRAENWCTGSAICTTVGQSPFIDPGVIILYAHALGAGDMFSLAVVPIPTFFVGLFSLVATVLTARQRYQTSILQATLVGLVGFLVVICAPFFSFGKWVVLAGVLCYGVANVIYLTSWQPLLNSFLSEKRRCLYLGKMRFSWQLAAAIFLFIVSRLIGKNPPIWYLQLVMVAGFFAFAIRLLCISSVPTFVKGEHRKVQHFHYKEGLLLALSNKALAGFSIYIFALNLFACATIPLTILHLKFGLQAPANVIVLMSSISLLGQLSGSFSSGRFVSRFGTRPMLLGCHTFYVLTNLGMFFMGPGVFSDVLLYTIVAVILYVHSFVTACIDVTSTNEMMHLATPGNEVIAMAFCNGLNYAGRSIPTMLSSLILGAGFLAPEWDLGFMHGLGYQTLFLAFAMGIFFSFVLTLMVSAIVPNRKPSTLS